MTFIRNEVRNDIYSTIKIEHFVTNLDYEFLADNDHSKKVHRTFSIA